MRLWLAFGFVLFGHAALGEEAADFRIYCAGDKVPVTSSSGEIQTVPATLAWVESAAELNPGTRFYWRNSPTDLVLVNADRRHSSGYIPSTSKPPEVRRSQWVDGRYDRNGAWVPGHMKTETSSGTHRTTKPEIHRYYRPSTGEPYGDRNPNTPRNQEIRRHYEQRESRAREKATSERLFGKPLQSLPRRP